MDPEKRLQWLKSRMPPPPAATPKVTLAPKAEPPPKIGFRSNPKAIATRAVEADSSETAPAKVIAAESRSAKTRTTEARSSKSSPIAPAPESPTTKTRTAESKPAKSTPAALAKATTPTPAPESASSKTRTAESKSAKSTPAPITKVTAATATPAPTSSRTRSAKATPTALAKLTTPVLIPEVPDRPRSTEVHLTPLSKPSFAPAITAISPTKMIITNEQRYPTASSSSVGGRYPWKTNIVTTVFWVGEAPSGNNFTPNHASSWDANWAASYGGFDNPDPAARRNYIPVRFTPRQNPFYVALPYNDVTRGTTKPEARRVIPWFKEAFRREGQSVCRDRWVAVRSRSGKVGYAQWSDCGPFRTDHWQYVFGSERPKPNLNKGAGLDVSPALRDFLGLSSTDVTDWKFVDFKDVPSGPWALHGENNTFALRGSRSLKASERTADNSPRMRIREL